MQSKKKIENAAACIEISTKAKAARAGGRGAPSTTKKTMTKKTMTATAMAWGVKSPCTQKHAGAKMESVELRRNSSSPLDGLARRQDAVNVNSIIYASDYLLAAGQR